MLLHRGIMHIAQFAVNNSRGICFTTSRLQLAMKRRFVLQYRAASTAVGYNSTPGLHNKDTPATQKSIERPLPVAWQKILSASNAAAETDVKDSFRVYEDFISEDKEQALVDEVQPYLRRLRYEHDHWDDAIVDYREMEKKEWSEKNKAIIQRMRELAFEPGMPQLEHVHVLDVLPEGCIKAHIDSVRYCGPVLSGLSLLSGGVMRLVHDKDKSRFVDILLNRRSFYVMHGAARYEYTHELLPNDQSIFKGQKIVRTRRISVICRADPSSIKD